MCLLHLSASAHYSYNVMNINSVNVTAITGSLLCVLTGKY